MKKRTPSKKGRRLINLPSNKGRRKAERIAAKIASKIAYDKILNPQGVQNDNV